MEEPALVDFSVHETALLNRETGKVHVIGSVMCSAPAKFEIRVSLLKERKRDGTQVVLASDGAAYTTGAVIPVDGGLGMGAW